MPKYCAQLNENGIVHTVCLLSEEIISANIIPLDNYDISVLGRKYNVVTGEFEEVEQETVNPPETIEQKLARIEQTQDLLLMMMLEQEGII